MLLNPTLFYTSLSQWTLFLGVALILFGWIEKRDHFVLAGQLFFLAMGFLSLWVLLGEHIHIPVVSGNVEPKEVKVLAYFKASVLFMGLTVISLILEMFKVRYRKYLVYLVVLVALMLFFMVFNVQQMAK